jgi:hypothetical protein
MLQQLWDGAVLVVDAVGRCVDCRAWADRKSAGYVQDQVYFVAPAGRQQDGTHPNRQEIN